MDNPCHKILIALMPLIDQESGKTCDTKEIVQVFKTFYALV